MNGRNWNMWHGDWPMFFGPVIWIVVLAVIVGGVILLLRPQRGRSGETLDALERRTPLDILEERFARGEIDEKEFRERKRALDE